MATFQASSSILSSTAVLAFVQEKYAVSKRSTCKLIKAGINHTYLISDEESRYVLRIYSRNWRSEAEIQEEISLLLRLKSHNISVSFPIADRAGSFIQIVKAPEGLRFAVMFSYAEGHKIQHYSHEAHFRIGNLMAQIHHQTKDLEQHRITYTLEVLLDQSLVHIQQFLSDDVPEMQFLMHLIPLLKEQLSQQNTQTLPRGIVHLDIWFDNLNISTNEEVTLFDFDFCGNGWLCLDIAYYIMQLHNTEKNISDREAKMDAFYRGYEAITQISAEEKRLVPILGVCLYYFYLGVQCQRFENWFNTFLNENYLKRYINLFIKGYYETIT